MTDPTTIGANEVLDSVADERHDATGIDGSASTGRTGADRRPTGGYLALVVAALGLVLAGGAGGAVVAAAVAVVWYALRAEYAFATGQVGLLATAADGGATYVLAAAALGGLLLAPLWGTAASKRVAVGGACLAAILGYAVWSAVAGGASVWTVALVLASAVAFAAYALHRYELVAIGLAGGERA